MIIQTWFPLAVGSSDLAPSEALTAAMLSELAPAIAAAAAQRRPDVAWTGDVNDCAGVHRWSGFAWLRGEVEREASAFVTALGYDLTRLQLAFDSSWPVLSTATEAIATHAHPTASLSAVYYLQVPPGPGGTLVFENWGAANALGNDLSRLETPDGEPNALNQAEACYEPVAGRLLLFPARQPHAVRPHESSGLRVVITFDLLLMDKAEATEDSPDAFSNAPAASPAPRVGNDLPTRPA